MKYKFLCVILIVTIIFGCGTKSQIKDSLTAHSLTNQYVTAAILSDNPKSNEFVRCVQEKLKDDLQYLKFFPGDKFRDAMFPWFETNTAPKNIEELSALLNKSLVKKRIESLGVDLLIHVHGYTKEEVSIGDAIVVLGAVGHRKTHILTTVWDLREIVRVGDTDISFEGIVVGGIGLIPPFVYIIPAFTETSVCKETAMRISNCLRGKVSDTDR